MARTRGPSLFDRRVLVVSGKGGTGKTTVAAACAMAAARTGKRVLLADVEGREGPAGLLGLPDPGFAERETPFGFRILSITPREALLEYLRLFFHMGALARTLERARVVSVATESIPGFRDLMTAGKLYELTQWRDRSRGGERRPYDLVVVDAPPTGQLMAFLRGPAGFRDLIRVGRPARQLEGIDRLLHDHSRLVLVCIPEDMAVEETLETASELRAEDLPLTAIVANQVHAPPFPRGTRAAALRLSPERLSQVARGAGTPLSTRSAVAIVTQAATWDARAAAERRRLRSLERAGPVIELPFLFTPTFGSPEVTQLADALTA
jgi:anion-transporting  ArsA/GET3 family ATPase